MSTWQEIRENILTLLDVAPDATIADDIRVAVDLKLKHARDRLYSLRVPDSLLVKSSAITVEDDTVYIKISGAGDGTHPTFALTDFHKIFALKIEDETWTPVRWGSWIMQQSNTAGDQRWRKSYSVDSDRYIYLRTLPGTGQTWSAELHYQKTPATIVDGGTPEIGAEHEELLVCSVVRSFPNRFITEERLSLLAAINSQYRELLSDYKMDSIFGKPDLRYKPHVRDVYERSVINWGDGDL